MTSPETCRLHWFNKLVIYLYCTVNVNFSEYVEAYVQQVNMSKLLDLNIIFFRQKDYGAQIQME